LPISVEPIAVRGEWIRHAPHRSTPLGHPTIATSGRWQHGDTIRGLYLADEPSTAIAEWYRWLAERALPPASGIPHDHHRWNVALDVADLSTAERLRSVGLEDPRPSRKTWSPYQSVGEKLWRDGWSGVLAPSAARPASLVVCIFCDRWPPSGCWPAGVDEVDAMPPPPAGMTT
jgi:RES domain-containing protein